jgi:hypothetical protein
MHDLRGQLDNDVEEVVDSAKEFTDWRTYVRSYPWACVGVAAAIGYLVVPSRVELESPDVDTLLELAKRTNSLSRPTRPPKTGRAREHSVPIHVTRSRKKRPELSWAESR